MNAEEPTNERVTPHSLASLTAREIESVREIAHTLSSSWTRFVYVGLDEPDKRELVRGCRPCSTLATTC